MLKHPESPGFLIDGFPRELDQGYQFEKEVMFDYGVVESSASKVTDMILSI